MQIAHGGSDLAEAARLAKPAILYADRVTIYSPAASLLRSVEEMASVTDPATRAAIVLQIAEAVPSLGWDLNVDPGTMNVMSTFLSLDPAVARSLLRTSGVPGDQVDDLFRMVDEMQSVWDEQMPVAVTRAREAAGASDLWRAVEDGAVEVHDIVRGRQVDAVQEAVQLASGHRPASDELTDVMIGEFVKLVVKMVTQRDAFPLLDPQSGGLIRSLEREAEVIPSRGAMQRGAEVDSAARFMGFLPSFDVLPMDEVLDLRVELRGPLVRYRSAVATLSRDFESRIIDDEFVGEVEDAWRRSVEPSLAEIRELSGDLGLLRQAASIAATDPQRLLKEAGGVLVLRFGDLLAISGMVTAASALAVPALDVTARAVAAKVEGRKGARRSAFYFLHKLADETKRRG